MTYHLRLALKIIPWVNDLIIQIRVKIKTSYELGCGPWPNAPTCRPHLISFTYQLLSPSPPISTFETQPKHSPLHFLFKTSFISTIYFPILHLQILLFSLNNDALSNHTYHSQFFHFRLSFILNLNRREMSSLQLAMELVIAVVFVTIALLTCAGMSDDRLLVNMSLVRRASALGACMSINSHLFIIIIIIV